MPSTFVSLLAIALGVLPGALYTWAFEREAGSFGSAFSDRVLRFIGVSAIFHVLFGWPEFLIIRRIPKLSLGQPTAGQFAVIWCSAAVYVAIPILWGSVMGGLWVTRETRTGFRRVRAVLPEPVERRLLRAFVGRDAAPRAWDHIFSSRPSVYVRIQLTDGNWVAGAFNSEAYASGFPNESDILLSPAWTLDKDRNLESPSIAVLYVPGSQIRLLELLTPEGEATEDEQAREQGSERNAAEERGLNREEGRLQRLAAGQRDGQAAQGTDHPHDERRIVK